MENGITPEWLLKRLKSGNTKDITLSNKNAVTFFEHVITNTIGRVNVEINSKPGHTTFNLAK